MGAVFWLGFGAGVTALAAIVIPALIVHAVWRADR